MTQARRKDKGQPGNGGQFTQMSRTDQGDAALAPAPERPTQVLPDGTRVWRNEVAGQPVIKITDPLGANMYVGEANGADEIVKSWFPDADPDTLESINKVSGSWSMWVHAAQQQSASERYPGTPISGTVVDLELTQARENLGLEVEVESDTPPG